MTSEQGNLQLSDITNDLVSELNKNNLPTNIDVLKRLLYKTQIDKSTLAEANRIVIDEVISISEESTIKIKRIDHCNECLKKLYNSYSNVRKFQHKRSKNVNDFFEGMTETFDISQDSRIKLLGSMDDAVKKKFLSRPVDYIKLKLPVIESQDFGKTTYL